MENTLFYVIIAIILFEYVFEQILDYLNLKNWSPSLPGELKDFYDEEKYRRSQQYFKTNQKFGFLSTTINVAAVLLMIILGGFALVDEWVRSVTEHVVWMPLLFFGILYIASDLLNLPFSLYKIFVIEEKFGFNRMNLKTFITDKVKGYLLAAVLGGGLLALIILFYERTGEWFWLYAWGLVTIVTLFFTMFYTNLIVPLFNKLKPLEEGELRDAIEDFAGKADFPLKNVYIMDGSKRSTKANAYFSGIGKKKSIVLFDTLIEDHTTEELVAILAHEVGHFKKKHIQKGFVVSTIQMGIMFFLLGWLLGNPALAAAFGVEESSFHIGLIGFGILYSPVSMFIGILMNISSRKNEYEADCFAVCNYKAAPLKDALKKLSVKHLSNLKPNPAYVFVHYSHPPLLKRISAMDKC